MRETGYELEDVGRTLSWNALGSFLHNIRPDSETAKELNADVSVWATQAKTNALLADIYDVLSVINANIYSLGSRKKAKKPQRYPRPGQDKDDVQRIGGKGSALPRDEMRSWIQEKLDSYKTRK